MSVSVWPEELPKPMRTGYQSQIDDARIAKNRDTGPIGWRRRWSSISRSVSLTVMVDRSLKAVFDEFYEYEVGAGSLPFWMPDPTTDGWALFTSDGKPLLTSDGTPILMAAQWLCIFGKQTPMQTIVGREFNISFSVVVLP